MSPEQRVLQLALVLFVTALGLREYQILLILIQSEDIWDTGRQTQHLCGKPAPEVTCDPEYRYRSADGSCNNLEHPHWGRSHTAQERFLLPEYDNGLDSPRLRGGNLTPLPSSREISNLLFHNRGNGTSLDTRLNLLHMSFGQFLDHDLALTSVIKGNFSCCGADQHRPECLSIPVPDKDPFFTTVCMPMTRSAWDFVNHRNICRREQINDVTSYLDASNVYGSNEEKAKTLRTFINGTLRERDGGLPDGGTSKCVLKGASDYCQDAGDIRVNVVPNLGSVHLLFVRYHNYIARHLGAMNPSWEDETLYQETRAILVAILQHVVYNEYLPLVLGNHVMKEYQLFPKPVGFNTVYNETVHSATRNAFAAAAFRFGHSQVTNAQKQYNRTLSQTGSWPIEDTYHSPHVCVQNGGESSEGVLRWQLVEPSAKSDGFFESGIRDKLFMDSDGNSLDLPALNVQRGRDHGLPPYWKWREFCGLNHTHLTDHDITEKTKLETVYRDFRDIDLYSGAMTELPLEGAIVGPTFACLIARQFVLYKTGDRFWYENSHGQGLTEDQLNEIKNITMASIVCRSVEVDDVNQNAFVVLSELTDSTVPVPCETLKHMNWTLWKDKSRKSQF